MRKTLHPLSAGLRCRAGLFTLTVCAAAALVACGSDDVAPTMLEGTVAVGAAVPGAQVTIIDADGATADISGAADASGAYALDVSTLKPPLLVSASGTLNGEPVKVVAVVPALSANADNTANVTSLTNAVAALIAPGGDLNALSSASAMAAVSASTVADASLLVINTLKSNPAFAALLGDGFDPLTTPFAANGTGIDSVLDQVAVELGSGGVVAITNLTAPNSDSGSPPAPVVLTKAQVATPTQAPTLPASEPPSNLPSTAAMTAIAKKLEACLALPLDQRVTMDANKNVTAVPAAACNYGVTGWKSDGGGWVERMGQNVFRYAANTGLKVGQPTIAAVLAAPNYSGTTFQHPHCNTQTCVIMYVPSTTASGKAGGGFWTLAKVNGTWEFVGNQLPYALFIEQRLNRKVAVNTALAAANPTNFYLQDRMESVLRLGFSPEASGVASSGKVRAVVWKGPGLPSAGVVTHRSDRCGTEDRFPITNQQGLLTVQNSNNTQWWNGGGGTEFMLDAAKLDGTPMTMPAPSTNWATNPTVFSQEISSSRFTGSIPAWSVYKAEIYYYSNNSNTAPDEVIYVRASTPFEPAANGATRNWPQLSSAFIDSYLKPTGANAGTLTSLAQTLEWRNPTDAYVSFAFLFSSNRISATNSQAETSNYAKRGSIWYRPNAMGDTSAPGYEWAPKQSGTALSPFTELAGLNPNPRCDTDEVLPLDDNASRQSGRSTGLQFRGSDRKLYNFEYFWSN